MLVSIPVLRKKKKRRNIMRTCSASSMNQNYIFIVLCRLKKWRRKSSDNSVSEGKQFLGMYCDSIKATNIFETCCRCSRSTLQKSADVENDFSNADREESFCAALLYAVSESIKTPQCYFELNTHRNLHYSRRATTFWNFLYRLAQKSGRSIILFVSHSCCFAAS